MSYNNTTYTQYMILSYKVKTYPPELIDIPEQRNPWDYNNSSRIVVVVITKPQNAAGYLKDIKLIETLF